MDQTLYNTWVEVLLRIVAAIVLTVGCLPRGTCYRHCPMFGSTIVVVLCGAEAAVVGAAVVEALALRVLALTGECPLLLTAALFGLLFLVQSIPA
jgi:hypothetical protein